ncbi:PiggyBac transposase Uribo1 [Elysia marginata]|uniref:PiggyBac transposase Uribo1 n=1 Tax=Elysia marginata TaxID=1093978 RepID=A0AAV4FC57_9GAST|nr:PiggyBac transposase Uribo1 [Elysia marginata]
MKTNRLVVVVQQDQEEEEGVEAVVHGEEDSRREVEDEEEDKRREAREWSTNTDEYVPTIPQFEGEPGVKVDTTGFTPSDFYTLFINDELINHMVIRTNLYARDVIASTQLKPSSRMHQWVPTDIGEMLTFLGLLLLMGIVKKPSFHDYWSTDPLIRTPVFPAAMSRDRFILILKFWHLNDNANQPPTNQVGRDRLFKIRPLLDHLFGKFQEVMEPGRDVAIDKSLLLWKDRLVFKQYIPLKRARFGIESFLLCDSSGYT